MRWQTWWVGLAMGGLAQLAWAAPVQVAQVNQRGDFVLMGNTLGQSCTAGTPAPVVGTVSTAGACGSGIAANEIDVFWRAEDKGTAWANTSITPSQARSTAVLNLPAGATVTHAWLYWSATLRTAPVPGTVTATLEVPASGSSQVVAASNVATTSLGSNWYRARADVTQLVQAHGAGAYRVGNIPTRDVRNLNDSYAYAGWWMVVFYERPSDPLRNLTLFDGMDLVQYGSPANATISGFQVPNGPFSAKLGVVALEGDAAYIGDGLRVNGGQLFDAQNPVDNFFNGSRSYLGMPVSNAGDLPRLTGASRSLAGLDFDVVDITPRLSQGATTASVSATSTYDVYGLATFITSIDTYVPSFNTSTMTVTPQGGGTAVLPGDELAYAVSVSNTGEDGASNLVLRNALPAGVSYVPGSLQVGGAPLTDAAGDDAADYNAATRTLTVRLGAGANAVQGGTMAVGAPPLSVGYRVTVDPLCSGDVQIANQASLSATGTLSLLPVTMLTDGDAATAGSQTTDTAVSVRCLTLSTSGLGAGSIDVQPATELRAQGAGQWAVATGTPLQLQAVPVAPAVFGQWGGGVSGTVNPLSHVMAADLAADAFFQLTQTVDFPQPTPASRVFVANQTFDVDPATSSLGLPITYASQDPAVCSVSGTTVTMLAVGECVIVAAQAGDADHLPAQTTRSVQLTQAVALPVPASSVWGLLGLAGVLAGLAARRRRA
ncbi:hypothetical protein CCO03_13670 [Comamonas serinivorans]|uniref:DUF11 domain-containing protein n=1 Tax=Comamonas serinivorans TaxID=1082851 RepID=A0A1Y0EQR1_9BURK|nr:DUF3344 domain-containing protein [Comamonas serinivorans]ARU05592.1 hypothetical protein CCO03_13670 [Comamonas serinivorans]